MSRTQQDQFIDDDEEETCPLCVEEFDLSDRGFRPCPCGYQVCQFCYHNVRNNMNGLCPACRRPYDDKTIEFRKPNAEEEAAWRARQASKQKKTANAQQKEAQRREADTANRKHLSGLRVVQKNLVYVTGLSPSVQEDRLLETLRGQQYFGQYGKIVKIVVSKAKDNQSSVGVYVTYARKEDAASCINAVDGSQNGDRTLRAQFGTTKYCSAYLRNEQCQNRSCMFLHEPGEDKDSFTRQDLSSMNVASSQQQQSAFMPSQAPPQSQQPVAAATRPDSTAPPATPAESVPALPSTASWASRPYPPSRSVSRATGAASASPALSNVVPVQPALSETSAPPSQVSQSAEAESAPAMPEIHPPEESVSAREPPNVFVQYVDRVFRRHPVDYVFSDSSFTDEQKKIIQNLPCLIDPNGGKRRRMLREKLEEERRRMLEARQTREDSEDILQRSGSLQLGGEPEGESGSGQQHAIQPPQQLGGGFDSGFSLDHDLSQFTIANRGMTPAQQQLLLQRFKSSPVQGQAFGSQQQAGMFNQMGQSNQPGHARNVSRFSFANDTSATASVKPVANSKLMSQQSSMMPPQSGSGFGQQPFHTSTVSGPPPGLKTTGTPPVSGGGMFGQGHGFATSGLGYGSNMASRNSNDEMMREIFRRRELGGQDAGKQPEQSLINPSGDILAEQSGTASFEQSSRPSKPSGHGTATPPVPPGLEGLGQASLATSQRTVNDRAVVRPAVPSGVVPTKSTPTKAAIEERITSKSDQTPITPSKITTKAAGKLPASSAMNPPLPQSQGDPPAPEQVTQKGQNQPTAASLVTPSKSVSIENATQMKQQQKTRSEKRDVSAAGVHSTVQTPTKPTAAQVIQGKIASAISNPQKWDSVDEPPSSVSSLDGSKRKHPGKIDIAAAINQPLDGAATPRSMISETPSKNQALGTPSVSSRPGSPGSTTDVSVKRKARTIRLVSTPKLENPSAVPLSAAASKLPSRNPSIASANPPGTPSSEQISDSVSLTSNTLSRPTSPPLGGIVGSATVRTKTKNQLKKERQERAKAIEEERKQAQEVETPATEEAVHEAITSRKKKAKKPSAAPKPKPRPEVVSAAPSPKEAPSAASEPEAPKPAVVPEPTTASPVLPPTPESAAAPTPATPEPSASTLISDLRSSSTFLSSCIDTFLRPLTTTVSSYKPTQPLNPSLDLDPARPVRRNPNIDVDPADLARVLSSAAPLQYGGESGRVWSHGCISPLGAHLRHLEPALEERFLQLEKELWEIPEGLRFVSRGVKAVQDALPRFDVGALKENLENGGARSRESNAMEKAVEEGSKKGSFLVGNAEGYVDEFIMPVTGAGVGGESGGIGGEGKGGRPEDGKRLGIEEIERLLADVKRQAEETERELRKAIKRNRKAAGYAH